MKAALYLTLTAIPDDHARPLGGDDDGACWTRALENGLRLAEETEANGDVVALFAVRHDSRRVIEVTAPERGPRAAVFAMELQGKVLDLDDDNFRLQYRACELKEGRAW